MWPFCFMPPPPSGGEAKPSYCVLGFVVVAGGGVTFGAVVVVAGVVVAGAVDFGAVAFVAGLWSVPPAVDNPPAGFGPSCLPA